LVDKTRKTHYFAGFEGYFELLIIKDFEGCHFKCI